MWQKFKYWTGRAVMALLVILFLYAFAQTLPFDFAMLAAVDMAVYVDALVGVYVIGRVARLRPMLAYLRLRLQVAARRLGTRARRTRMRIVDRMKQPANDDEPGFAVAA